MNTCESGATHRRLLNTTSSRTDHASSRLFVTSALLFLSLVLAPQPALAYLEPGTGSLLMQTLVGLGAGALVAGRLYWARIKGLFRRLLRLGTAQHASPENSDESKHT